MILHVIEHIAGRSGHFLHGVNAGFEIVDDDFAVGVRNTVKVVTAILDFGDTEGRAGEHQLLFSIVFYDNERGLFGVGEHKGCGFARFDLDGALGIVDEVAIGGRDLFHDIGAGVELGQVNLAAGVRGELVGEVAAHLRDAEFRVGQGFHGLRVQLHDVDAGFDVVEEYHGVVRSTRVQLDFLRGAVYNMAVRGANLFHKIGAGSQVIEEDFTVGICGVFTDQLGVAVDRKGHAAQPLHGLPVILHDAEHRHGLVGHGDPGVIRGGGIVIVHIDAVLGGIQHIAGRSNGLLHGVVACGHIGNIGKAAVVGGDGREELAISVNLKGRAAQTAVVALVALVDDDGRRSDIVHGDDHITLAIPMHGLRGRVQLISNGGCDLIDLVAAHGELFGVELDDAGLVGGPHRLEGTVDLLKANDRALEGIAGLLVHLFHGELLLGAVLHGHIVGPRRLNLNIDGVNDGVACGSLCLGQGISYLGVELLPEDDAVIIGDAGAGAAIRAGQRELRAGKGQTARAGFRDLKTALLGLGTAPLERGVGGQRSLAGVRDDIGLLIVHVVLGEIDFILHDKRAAVDLDLAAVGDGIDGNAHLRNAEVFKAVAVERGVVIAGVEPPCVVLQEGPTREFIVGGIDKNRSLRRIVRPELQIVLGVVGGCGGGEDILAGEIALAVDDLALEAELLVVSGVFQRHIAGDGDIAAQLIFFQPDIHSGLIHLRPGVRNIQDELNRTEHAHLLGIAAGLRNGLTPAAEGGAFDGELSKRCPDRKLRGIPIFLFGQTLKNRVVRKVKAEEGLKAVLRVAIGKRAGSFGACVILAGNGQGAGGEIEPMIDAVRGTSQTVVGRVLIGGCAQLRSRRRAQIVVAVYHSDGGGGASVRNRRGAGVHGKHPKKHQNREKQRKRPRFACRFGHNGSPF